MRLEKQTNSVAKKLVIKILVASAMLTSIFTFVTFYNDYTSKKENLSHKIDTLEESFLDVISRAIWNYNNGMVDVQINSLLKIKEVISVKVVTKNDKVYEEKKINYSSYKNIFSRSQEMYINSENEEARKHVGSVQLEITEDYIQQEILNSFVSFLIFQSIKSFLITIVIIFILNKYLINHIKKITEFFSKQSHADPTEKPQKLVLQSDKNGRDEIDILVNAVNKVAITTHKYLVEQERRLSLQGSLEAAEIVQESLLPVQSKEIPGVKTTSSYDPAEHTGGDWYYHYYDDNSNIAYFFCGDVTGHGISSALLTAVICGNVLGAKNAISSFDREHQMEKNLEALANSLNQSILDTGSSCDRLMTMAMLSLNLETGELCFLNAGHNHPFWFSKKGKSVKALLGSGSRLGNTIDPKFRVKTYHLDPGDRVFLFTDGLVENTCPDGNSINRSTLKSLLNRPENSLQEIHDDVLLFAQELWQDHAYEDDVTTLFIEWHTKTYKTQKAS